VEGLHQTYKLPLNADTQFRKLALFARQDAELSKHVPDLEALLKRVLDKLEREPMVVEVTHPASGSRLSVPVGRFGLQIILRFDLGDASDLPVFPKLLHSIDEGDPTVLQWFVQKRMGILSGVSGMTMIMDASSGASPERLAMIASQAERSLFGNVMNFPFLEPGYLEVWQPPDLGEAFRAPLVSDVRTLFLTGTLDWNTPPHQAEEVRWGFTHGTHLIVENAGHEQILTQPQIGKAIVRFLAGEDVSDVKVALPPIRFVPIEGYDPAVTHPSVAARAGAATKGD
jgi:pimeloyl-ACP methyl ester carboxylesterase